MFLFFGSMLSALVSCDLLIMNLIVPKRVSKCSQSILYMKLLFLMFLIFKPFWVRS